MIWQHEAINKLSIQKFYKMVRLDFLGRKNVSLKRKGKCVIKKKSLRDLTDLEAAKSKIKSLADSVSDKKEPAS